MTDPDLADRTYVEPLTVAFAEEIIRKERPDALLSTVGGQTGLNLVDRACRSGRAREVRRRADRREDRRRSRRPKTACCSKTRCGRSASKRRMSQLVNTVEGGVEFAEQERLSRDPAAQLHASAAPAAASPTTAKNSKRFSSAGSIFRRSTKSLIEESVLGWKEYELEVMRDLADNAIIICSIENFDPMGVHTGDSITVAPAQTLTDREYQMMRDVRARAVCARSASIPAARTCSSPSIPQNGRMVDHRDESARVAQLGAGVESDRIPDRQDRRETRRRLSLDEIKNDITQRRRRASSRRSITSSSRSRAGSLKNSPAPSRCSERR